MLEAAERIPSPILPEETTDKASSFLPGITEDTEATDIASNTVTCTLNIKESDIEEEETDVDAKNDDGDTALHLASRAGDMTTARTLLEKGADIAIENNSGETALDAVLRMTSLKI